MTKNLMTQATYSDSAFEGAYDYIERVCDGRRSVSELERLAVERHLRDLEHGSERGLVFDASAVDRVFRFFSMLRHYKGEWAGQQFVLGGWQAFITLSIFGWKIEETGTRRYRDAYLEVPRKNGKSMYAGAVGLYLTGADNEPAAEVYSAATKRDQAKLIFEAARQMVIRSPGLSQYLNALKQNIDHENSGSIFQPVSADAATLDGLNVHGGLIDELHEHKTAAVTQVLDTATGARRQPLILKVTTAGWDRNSVCWREHEYSERILRQEPGFEDDSYFAFLSGVDPGDDWRSEATWEKANPNYGSSVSIADLRRKFSKAELVASEQNNVRRKHLNEWTQQENRWLDMAAFDACADVDIDPAELVGRACYGGLDFSTTYDLTSLVLVFPPTDADPMWRTLPRFWFPSGNIEERERRDRVPLAGWARDKWLTLCRGNVIDQRFVEKQVEADSQLYKIVEIGYDPWNAVQTAIQLEENGHQMVQVRQGPRSYNEAMSTYMGLILSREFANGTSPVLRWCASNLATKRDSNGNLAPDKDKSSDRIDGMVALLMGLARAINPSAAVPVNPYESRGLRSLTA